MRSCRYGVSQLVRLAAFVAVAMTAGGCGGSTPVSPTRSMQLDSGGFSSAIIEASAVSWSAFTRQTRVTAAGHGASPGALQAPLLAAPFNLAAQVQGSTVTLTWTAPPPPAQPISYIVDATTPSGATVASFDTGSAATTMTVSRVPNGTYRVSVRARDAIGPGFSSNAVVVLVGGAGVPPPTCPPGAPQNLTALPIGGEVTLFWEPADSACGEVISYQIVAGSAPGGANLAVLNTGTPINSFNASNIGIGMYYVRVRASDGLTFGAFSNEVLVNVTSAGAPPGTTRWVSLLATGDGVSFIDPECNGGGLFRADLVLVFVQNGNSATGTSTATIQSPDCAPVGTVFADTFTATITGVLGSGSGTVEGMTTEGERFTGTFQGDVLNGLFQVEENQFEPFTARRR